MNVIGGRGGILVTLLGLFYYLFAAVFVAAFYIFALGIGALALLMAYTWRALRRRRERKRTPPAPPVPVMSRVR